MYPRIAASLAYLLLAFGISVHAAPPLIGFVSDFGLDNESVGVCKGVMYRLAPEARIVDLTHNVPAFDIWEGSIVLRETTSFPAGTVFVAVIDPGVGSNRQAVALRTDRSYVYIAPNNGLLSWVVQQQQVEELVELDSKRVNPQWKPGTFDGRDLFSPAAALIARGGQLAEYGTPMPLEELVLFDIPKVRVAPGVVSGIMERMDKPYGNALTTVTRSHLEAAAIRPGQRLVLQHETGPELELPFVTTFSDVPEGRPLAYLDSRGHLAFAVNQGHFMGTYGVGIKEGFHVERMAAEEDTSTSDQDAIVTSP